MAPAAKKKAVGDHSPAAAPAPMINLSDSDKDDWSDELEEPRARKVKTECALPDGFLDPLRATQASKVSKFPGRTHKLGNTRRDETEIQFLLKLLVDHNEPQWRHNDVWLRGAWDRITGAFNKRFLYANAKKSQLKCKICKLKRTYKILKRLSETDGLSWDSKNNMLQGQDDVWQKLVLTNEDAKKWHKTPWPYYAAFQKLFEGRSVEEKQSTVTEDSRERVKACHQANATQDFELGGETIINSPSISAPLRNPPFHSSPKQNRLSQPPDERDFSIKTCMEAFYKLDGFPKEDLFGVGKVFKRLENREMFLSLRDEDREIWLREEVDEVQCFCMT